MVKKVVVDSPKKEKLPKKSPSTTIKKSTKVTKGSDVSKSTKMPKPTKTSTATKSVKATTTSKSKNVTKKTKVEKVLKVKVESEKKKSKEVKVRKTRKPNKENKNIVSVSEHFAEKIEIVLDTLLPKQHKEVKSILVTLPKPENGKSAYYDIANKYNILVDFFPFVIVEGISGKDFKKQKIDIAAHSAIIFTSRNAIDHFFRICEENKVKVSQDMKYFCISEAIALYLQKFILYRKRKVFYSADGTTEGLLEVISKHKFQEKYILPTADNGKSDINTFLSKNKISFTEATLYRTVSNDIQELMEKKYDLLLFFSTLAVQTLFDSFPDFLQNDTIIAAFTPVTAKAIQDANLRLDFFAPTPEAISMSSAVDLFLIENKKNRK